MKKTTFTKLVSPTRGENYTITDALLKFEERASVLGECKIKKIVETMYGDKDYIVTLTDFAPSSPIWCDSIDVVVNGELLLHTTSNGKIELGWGCGMSDAVNVEFLDVKTREKHIKEWEKQGDSYCGNITITGSINENIETISIDEISRAEVELLLQVIEKDMASRFIGMVTRTNNPYYDFQNALEDAKKNVKTAKEKYDVLVSYELENSILSIQTDEQDTSEKIEYTGEDYDFELKIFVSIDAYERENQIAFKVARLFGFQFSQLSQKY